MDMERHCPVVEDINEQDGQCQPRDWRFNEYESQESLASQWAKFMSET